MQKTSFFTAALFDRSFRASPSSLKRDVNNPIQSSTSLSANGTVAQSVSYTHLRAHETDSYLVCRLLLEKKKQNRKQSSRIHGIELTLRLIVRHRYSLLFDWATVPFADNDFELWIALFTSRFNELGDARNERWNNAAAKNEVFCIR